VGNSEVVLDGSILVYLGKLDCSQVAWTYRAHSEKISCRSHISTDTCDNH